jgi:tRNA isopentenyl-2-thiomethyl-A-37 hydroxylase MiaE
MANRATRRANAKNPHTAPHALAANILIHALDGETLCEDTISDTCKHCLAQAARHIAEMYLQLASEYLDDDDLVMRLDALTDTPTAE